MDGFFKILAQFDSGKDYKAHWLNKFGSVEAIEKQTEQEAKLDLALKPWEVVTERIDPATKQSYRLYSYRGFTSDPLFYEDLTPEVIQAVSEAYPIPNTLRAVLQERQAWDDLGAAREKVLGWQLGTGALARELVLEEILSTRPAVTLDDIAARVDWWHSRVNYDFDLGREFHDQMHKRLQDDFALVAGMHAEDVP